MQIAISSQGTSLDDVLDPRFGRAAYFIFYDMDTGEVEARDNPALDSPSGAGIEAARFLAQCHIQVAISGRFGPKAYQALEAAGLQVVSAPSLAVREVIEKYKAGKLSTARMSRGGRRGR